MKRFLLVLITLASSSALFSQNSIAIGQSSNAYSMLRTSQNQIFVDPSLNTVGFIYRHNIALYGGGTTNNGKLRFSISTNSGVNWHTELGVLNNTYTQPARYPQAWLYNPTSNTDPFSAYIVWSGPTIPANFDGLVTGTCQVDTANPVTTTENYQFQNSSSLIPGGLCESTSGIFWMVENASVNDTTYIDSINVYKGTYGAGNVVWVKQAALHSPHSLAFDGKPHLTGPNIAFSPDGQTGYIVFLGDINAPDSTYNPIIYKSTDAGSSWSTATELIIDNIPGVADSIKQFLFDTGTAIESATEVATAFECDITVDSTSNLHIFTTLCAVERRDTLGVVTGAKSYVVYSGYPKNAMDIYSTNGGTTWTSLYVGQINEFRTSVTSTPSALGIDNFPQISRTKDGKIIFYSWSDTDTLIHQGATTNEAPNTFVAGFNIGNGKRTCWKQIFGVTNEDFAITPAMAPLVLVGSNGGPEYTLPIVTQEVPVDALSPTNFYYVGKGAKFCDEDFKDPSAIDLSWSFTSQCYNYSSCFAVGIENYETNHFNLYPNPASDMLNVDIMDLVNITGLYVVNQLGQIMKVMTPGSQSGTIQVDISGLPSGMYNLNINANGKTYSKKFSVIR
jgi:hypothetical protein